MGRTDNINLGEFDVVATIMQRPSRSYSSSGTDNSTWVSVKKIMVSIESQVQQDADIYNMNNEKYDLSIITWDNNLTTEHRISINGKVYEIVSISKIKKYFYTRINLIHVENE